MTIHRHIDFEVPDWGEVDAGPTTRGGYIDEVMADGPIALWRFDEANGATAADAISGRDLNLVGGYMRGDAGPLAFDSAQSTAFDGINGIGTCADPSILSGRSACTITFWLRFDGAFVSGDHAVFSSWQSGANGVLIWVDKSASVGGTARTLSFAASTIPPGSAIGRVEGPTDLIRPGQWDFFACVFIGGASLAIYRGSHDLPLALVGSTSGAVMAMPALGQPIIAASTSSPALIGYLPGALANLTVYDAALSSERLEAQLNAGVGRWA